jgi:hypothetical protein
MKENGVPIIRKEYIMDSGCSLRWGGMDITTSSGGVAPLDNYRGAPRLGVAQHTDHN